MTEDKTVKMYTLVLSSSKDDKARIVGVCGFTSIDYVNSRAEFSLYVSPEAQRNQIGTKGLRVLLEHGFKNHGFNVIYGEVFKGNPALGMFLTMGFVDEGTRREFYFRDGQFIDAIMISMKRSEWKT